MQFRKNVIVAATATLIASSSVSAQASEIASMAIGIAVPVAQSVGKSVMENLPTIIETAQRAAQSVQDADIPNELRRAAQAVQNSGILSAPGENQGGPQVRVIGRLLNAIAGNRDGNGQNAVGATGGAYTAPQDAYRTPKDVYAAPKDAYTPETKAEKPVMTSAYGPVDATKKTEYAPAQPILPQAASPVGIMPTNKDPAPKTNTTNPPHNDNGPVVTSPKTNSTAGSSINQYASRPVYAMNSGNGQYSTGSQAPARAAGSQAPVTGSILAQATGSRAPAVPATSPQAAGSQTPATLPAGKSNLNSTAGPALAAPAFLGDIEAYLAPSRAIANTESKLPEIQKTTGNTRVVEQLSSNDAEAKPVVKSTVRSTPSAAPADNQYATSSATLSAAPTESAIPESFRDPVDGSDMREKGDSVTSAPLALRPSPIVSTGVSQISTSIFSLILINILFF